MTAKYFSIRQKIGEKCISVNAPIIPVPTGQKCAFACSQGLGCQGPDCPLPDVALCSDGTAEWLERHPFLPLSEGPGCRPGKEP